LGEEKFIQESAMNLTNKARSLRKNQTDVEQLLWKHLRNRHLYNYKFRRQFSIEPYIADFACLELKLIILSVGDDPAKLSLLIAAFLIIKGIFRIVVAYATQIPNIVSTTVGAGVSIILGLLIWLEWPSPAAWFLAFCLSAEIGLRGWSLIMFAFWIKSQKERESASY
jgi:hypothetical protein